jgi:hypothetical protein
MIEDMSLEKMFEVVDEVEARILGETTG